MYRIHNRRVNGDKAQHFWNCKFVFIRNLFCLFIKLEAVDKEQDSGILSQVGFEVAGEGSFYRIAVNKADKDDLYYAFLPSYTDVGRIRMSIHGGGKVNINGTDIVDGDYLDKFETNQEYSIVLYSPKNKITEQANIQFLVSANLPAVYITTKSGSMEYINSEKGNKESGFITITSEMVKKFIPIRWISWAAEEIHPGRCPKSLTA